jgi:hypothetical protein
LHLLPRKKKQARCELVARSHPLYAAYIRRGGEIAERHTRGAKDEEQFAGPEQNIEQTRALEVRQTLGVQTDFESFLRALFDEGTHSGEIHTLFARFLAARVNGFQLRVAAEKKMVQAKILLIQGSSRGAVTSTLAAVSFRKFRIHRAHTS